MKRVPLFWLVGFGIFCLLCPEQSFHLERSLQFPNDSFGRNLFLLVGQAARGSLAFSLLTLISTSILALGFAGGIAVSPPRVRFAFERFLEFLIAFPSLLIALAGQAILGTGTSTLALSLGLGLLPSTIRFLLVRSRELLAEDYVTSAHALGATPLAIARRHLLPGLLEHLRIKLPFLFAQTIGIEATLTFLGLGSSPGTVTWGGLLAQGKDYLVEAPYISLMGGLPLLLTLLALSSLESTLGERRKTNVS